MPLPPLDPLGQAMAAYRERERHDIDWHDTPLGRYYAGCRRKLHPPRGAQDRPAVHPEHLRRRP